MVQRVTIQITDDFTGEEGASTYSFAYNGTAYEIDLTDANAKKFAKVLDPYIATARKQAVRGRRTGTRPAASSDRDPKAIRAWAQDNGYDIPARGRIPAEVEQAYNTAN